MSKSLWCTSATTGPTPFDEITPEMLEGAGKTPEPPARYEMRCGHCNTTLHIGHETDPEEVFGEDLDRNVCVSCGENLGNITLRQLRINEPCSVGPTREWSERALAFLLRDTATFTRLRKWEEETANLPNLRDITAAELQRMGLRLQASQPEPPPTGNGELVTPPLLAALEDHPDLHALVAARDAFGRSKYGTGLRCHNGRNPLEDARQELGDLLQYLWQSLMEGRNISGQLNLMAQAITVLQQQRSPRAGGQMQTLTLQIFEPSKPFGGIFVAENAPETFVAAIQDLLTLTIQRDQPSGEEVTILEFVWNGEGVPGLLAGDMADDEAIFILSDVLEETAGIWDDLDTPIACYTSSGVGNNRRIKRIGDLTVRQCLHAAEPA